MSPAQHEFIRFIGGSEVWPVALIAHVNTSFVGHSASSCISKASFTRDLGQPGQGGGHASGTVRETGQGQLAVIEV